MAAGTSITSVYEGFITISARANLWVDLILFPLTGSYCVMIEAYR